MATVPTIIKDYIERLYAFGEVTISGEDWIETANNIADIIPYKCYIERVPKPILTEGQHWIPSVRLIIWISANPNRGINEGLTLKDGYPYINDPSPILIKGL